MRQIKIEHTNRLCDIEIQQWHKFQDENVDSKEAHSRADGAVTALRRIRYLISEFEENNSNSNKTFGV